MSEIRKTKNPEYDKPEHTNVPGSILDVYAVIDDALDNGMLARRSLIQAGDIGKKTLDIFVAEEESWIVYAELTSEVRREHEGEPALRSNLSKGPTNTYGQVTDIDVINDINGNTILAATVEPLAIGQYERYIVPLARQGDKEVLRSRPVDMPPLRRDLYKRRLNQAELDVAADFWDFLGSSSPTGSEVAEYFQEQTAKRNAGGFKQYMTALNLEIEDTYSTSDPYQVTICEGTIVVDYDQSFKHKVPYYEYPENETFSLLGIRCVRDHTKRQIHEISMSLVSEDNDLVATVRLDEIQAIFLRNRPDESI